MERLQIIIAHFWIALTLVLVLFLSACANIKEWRKTITEDQISKVRTTEIYYKTDSGFDLGTEGLGEYYLFKIEGF